MIGRILRAAAAAAVDRGLGYLASRDKPRAGAVALARVAALVAAWSGESVPTDAAVDSLAIDAAAYLGVRLNRDDVRLVRERVGAIVLDRELAALRKRAQQLLDDDALDKAVGE